MNGVISILKPGGYLIPHDGYLIHVFWTSRAKIPRKRIFDLKPKKILKAPKDAVRHYFVGISVRDVRIFYHCQGTIFLK